MVELYVQDKLVQLIGNEKISADYGLLDINDIGTRKGTRGYLFALPKTNVNKSVFESPEIINNLSRLPYIKLKARLYVDGVDSNIRFASLETVNQTYNLRLYGSNSDFFFDAKQVKLIELDFCEYDHFWTLENFVASFPNTDGYIYSLIDYHSDSPNTIIDNTDREFDVRYCLPAIYGHTILEKISEHFDIPIHNEVEQTIDYPVDRIVYPFSNTTKVRNRLTDRYQVRFDRLTDYSPNDLMPGGITPGEGSPGIWLKFDDYTVKCGRYWDAANWDPYIRFAEKVKFKLKFKLILDAEFYPATFATIVFINTNIRAPFDYNPTDGFFSQNATNNLEFIVNFANGQQIIEGEYTFITERPDVLSGDYNDTLNIWFGWAGGLPSPILMRSGSYLEFSEIEILEDGPIEYNNIPAQKNYITVSSTLPDIDCAEFIKQYCLQMGAVPIINNITGDLSIIPFDRVKDNISSAKDWSAKVDYGIQNELAFEYLDYAQNNVLKYADDDSVIKPEGTDGAIVISNENLEKEKVIIELIFAATETAIRLKGIEMPHIKLWGDDGETFADNAITNRVLIIKRYNVNDLPDTSTVIFKDGTGTILVTNGIPIGYFIKSDEVYNLGFDNSLIEKNYEVLSAILGNIKTLSEYIRLNISDINQLNHLIPVWIERHNAYFYVSNVKSFEYTSSRSTLVELVKLNIN